MFAYIRDGGLNIPHKYKLLYGLYKPRLKNLCNIPPPVLDFLLTNKKKYAKIKLNKEISDDRILPPRRNSSAAFPIKEVNEMKKATPVLFSFLLTVALVFCLPLVAFRAEGISEAEGERYVSYIPLEVYRGCSDLSQFPDGFQCAVAEPLFSELFRLKLLPEDYRSVTFDSTPSSEELASFPKVSLADVAAVVDSMYGVGASALLTPSQGFSACKKMHLIYLEETKEFAFYKKTANSSASWATDAKQYEKG